MKYLLPLLCLTATLLSGCNKAIAPYKFVAFDSQHHTAHIVIEKPLDQSTWLNTSLYVLDSINMDMNRNKTPKGQSISVVTYTHESDAHNRDTAAIKGRYTYVYDTKEQLIDFRK